MFDIHIWRSHLTFDSIFWFDSLIRFSGSIFKIIKQIEIDESSFEFESDNEDKNRLSDELILESFESNIETKIAKPLVLFYSCKLLAMCME